MFCFLFITLMMISCNSLEKVKFCMNCKHFLDSTIDTKYGKCSLFPKEDKYFLVSKNLDKEYKHAVTAREYEDMCGKEGKLYIQKYKKRATKIIENKEKTPEN